MAAEKKTGAKKPGTTRADRAAGKKAKTEEESRSAIRFTYDDDREIVFDTNSMTLGEQIEVEEVMNMPFGQVLGTGWLVSSKCAAVLAAIARRRDEPTYSNSAVLESTELKVEIGVPPTETPETSGRKD